MSADPWTVYWQGDNPESCIASKSPGDREEIAAYWKVLAERLPDTASVLDLACGNGAIARVLLSVKNSIEICGVDKAQIDPQKYLSEVASLATVRFIPETDICDLPLADESFDAVTSQFGLEYAPLAEACQSAARVLKRGGILRLLLHHTESEIVRPASVALAEIARLLQDPGVLQAAESYVAGEMNFHELETVGKKYLHSDHPKTSHLSGQIFAGIDKIASELKSNPTTAKARLETMRMRLLAEQSRLIQLQDAALDTHKVSTLETLLRDADISIDKLEPFFIGMPHDGQILIGWQLAGVRK